MINCFPIPTSFRSVFWPQDNATENAVKSPAPGYGKIWFSFFIIFFFIVSCSQRQIAESAEISTFHKGSLQLSENAAAPKLVYVDCRQGSGAAPHLDSHLAKALAKGKFRLTDSPSKAGYILHVNILRHGQVAPEKLRSAVNSGYGTSASFSGSGANAMLVDALMVQRRVPESGKSASQKLKNITSRNALDSSQMRIGAMTTGKKHSPEDFSAAIARELALRVEK